jgi:hypothetical protein
MLAFLTAAAGEKGQLWQTETGGSPPVGGKTEI